MGHLGKQQLSFSGQLRMALAVLYKSLFCVHTFKKITCFGRLLLHGLVFSMALCLFVTCVGMVYHRRVPEQSDFIRPSELISACLLMSCISHVFDTMFHDFLIFSNIFQHVPAISSNFIKQAKTDSEGLTAFPIYILATSWRPDCSETR